MILVDGNSQDDTIEAARRAYPAIRVLTQSGRGKGDAFRTGFAAVTGNLVVMLDADGSADPAEIPRFVAALEAGADFAKGSRFLEGGGSADITRLRSLGNTFLSGTANLLHGTHFTDLCYGYNAFWARCLPFISLDVPGFEVETLINLRIAGAGMKITEVPSYEQNRISGQSNLNTFRDGFRVLGTIIGEARRRRTIRSERPQVVERKQSQTGSRQPDDSRRFVAKRLRTAPSDQCVTELATRAEAAPATSQPSAASDRPGPDRPCHAGSACCSARSPTRSRERHESPPMVALLGRRPAHRRADLLPAHVA